MNKKRTEFLVRNTDPSVKSYLIKLNWTNKVIVKFVYYPYAQHKKGNKTIPGFMLLPYTRDEWTEDKLWVTSLEDAEFFVKWYNEKWGAKAILLLDH